MLQYKIVYEKTDRGYKASIPDVPGCSAVGRTKKQAERNIHETLKFYMEEMNTEEQTTASLSN